MIPVLENRSETNPVLETEEKDITTVENSLETTQSKVTVDKVKKPMN